MVDNANRPFPENLPGGERARAQRDPALDAVIQAEGHGQNPLGVYAEQKLYVSAARHNPYLNLVSAVVGIAVGTFLLTKLGAPWGIVVAGVFFALSLFIVIRNAMRVPAWHRARAAAKAYLHQHGGEMPPELHKLS